MHSRVSQHLRCQDFDGYRVAFYIAVIAVLAFSDFLQYVFHLQFSSFTLVSHKVNINPSVNILEGLSY